MIVKAGLQNALKRADCAELMRILDNTFIYRAQSIYQFS